MSRVRVINENGECACQHRDLSVCPECWDATPGLIEVYSMVYRWSEDGWTEAEAAEIAEGLMDNVRLSPGTPTSERSIR